MGTSTVPKLKGMPLIECLHKYNNIINKIAVEKKDHIITIDPLHNVHEDLFVDGYHCNSNGMEKVYHDLDGLEINNLV